MDDKDTDALTNKEVAEGIIQLLFGGSGINAVSQHRRSSGSASNTLKQSYTLKQAAKDVMMLQNVANSITTDKSGCHYICDWPSDNKFEITDEDRIDETLKTTCFIEGLSSSSDPSFDEKKPYAIARQEFDLAMKLISSNESKSMKELVEELDYEMNHLPLHLQDQKKIAHIHDQISMRYFKQKVANLQWKEDLLNDISSTEHFDVKSDYETAFKRGKSVASVAGERFSNQGKREKVRNIIRGGAYQDALTEYLQANDDGNDSNDESTSVIVKNSKTNTIDLDATLFSLAFDRYRSKPKAVDKKEKKKILKKVAKEFM